MIAKVEGVVKSPFLNRLFSIVFYLTWGDFSPSFFFSPNRVDCSWFSWLTHEFQTANPAYWISKWLCFLHLLNPLPASSTQTWITWLKPSSVCSITSGEICGASAQISIHTTSAVVEDRFLCWHVGSNFIPTMTIVDRNKYQWCSDQNPNFELRGGWSGS